MIYFQLFLNSKIFPFTFKNARPSIYLNFNQQMINCAVNSAGKSVLLLHFLVNYLFPLTPSIIYLQFVINHGICSLILNKLHQFGEFICK